MYAWTHVLRNTGSPPLSRKRGAERREREGDREPGEPRRGTPNRSKVAWFKPSDKRVPRIAIPTERAPPDFIDNFETYANKLSVACIKVAFDGLRVDFTLILLPASSWFFLHPLGSLIAEPSLKSLGGSGLEAGTSALLKNCKLLTEDLSDNALKCLSQLPLT